MVSYLISYVRTKIGYFLAAIGVLILAILTINLWYIDSEPSLSPYPYGANFAFTITEDPDSSRLDETKIVYDFLKAMGLRTTIAVWTREATRNNGIPDVPRIKDFGVTCENSEYLEYVKLLSKEGFEIALHTVSGGNDLREKTISGYEEFKLWFGDYPKINIMHQQNLENVYWGKKVVSNRLAQLLIGIFINRSEIPYSGEDPDSKYFWGDILKQKTQYVRLFGTSDINTLQFNPSMPYHDRNKPYVNYWFSFSDGFGVEGFNSLISKKNLDQLVKERGASIVYTHFAHGFVQEGRLNETFQRSIKYLTSLPNGWFVPASDILDRLLLMKKVGILAGEDCFMVVNLNNISINGVTVLVPNGEIWYGFDGSKYNVNKDGEIIIETLQAGGGVVLFKDKAYGLKYDYGPTSAGERLKIIDFETAFYITRYNKEEYEGHSELNISKQRLFNTSGQEVLIPENGQIPEALWADGNQIVLFKNENLMHSQKQYPGWWEQFNMVFQRTLLYLKHNISI